MWFAKRLFSVEAKAAQGGEAIYAMR